MSRTPPAWARPDGGGGGSAPTNLSPSGPPRPGGGRPQRARVRRPSSAPPWGRSTGHRRTAASQAARATAPEARGAARSARCRSADASHPGPRSRVRCSGRVTARSSAGQSSSPPRHPRSCDPALTARSPERAASRSDPGPTGASLPDPRRSDDQQPAPWLASAPHGAPAYPVFNNPGILNPSPSPGARITLPGHARFSKIADCLSGRMRADAGISWRERGIDGWKVAIHRSLLGELPPAEAMAEEPSSAAGTGNSCAYEIDVPQREDAPAIARCFLAVYGHAYVHPEVFSPHHYWDKVERGELIPVVARDGHGEIVGHLALERGPGTQVAERGEAVVLPAHRSHGLLERMTERLSEVAVRHNLQGIYAEPVTIHTYSQRNDERAGMPVCAVLLGVNPDTFHPKGMPCVAGQRQSYLRTFRFLRPPAPRTIHAPEPYREVLHRIYASLGADVTEAAEPGSAAPQSCTSIRVNGRGYGVIAFEQIGVSAAIEL